MRILHFTLGLPPYHSGGLTKYATDLMVAQSACGEDVSLLYPGDYSFWKLPKTLIKSNNSYKGVGVYEIKNPSPVPLLHGIRNPSDIFEPKQRLSEKELAKFYNEVIPEVFHIHTLMGLPMELVDYLKRQGVKIVFTSHDYYGLCMKVNFINQFGVLCAKPSGMDCALCNCKAPSSLFLRLRNSKYILKYKTKISGAIIRKGISKNQLSKMIVPTQDKIIDYSNLLKYFHNFFDLVDCFHFNSTVSKEVYEQYLTPKQFVVLTVSNANIIDARRLIEINTKQVRLGFIGNTTVYKGFPLLKQVLCGLENGGVTNWSLQVWGDGVGIDPDCDKIYYKGKYTSENLENVFAGMDLLIVPSVWKETFSLITLEALSYGVPALVSNNVGAKDIVNRYNSDFVFQVSQEALSLILKNILSNPMLLCDYNKKILSNPFEYSFDDHIEEINQLYTSLLSYKK